MSKQGGRMPREDRVNRKKEVEILKSHPLIIEFFTKAEENVFTRWKQSTTSEERELLWLTKLGLEAFEQFFDSILIDGKMAEKDLQDLGKLTRD